MVTACRGSPEPMVDPLLRPNPRLCAESVTGNLHNTTTPAPDPSSVVLTMLFMYNTTGLATRRRDCRAVRVFGRARWRLVPLPFPSAVYRAVGSVKAAGRERVGESAGGVCALVQVDVTVCARSVARVSQGSCLTRRHRRQIRALSTYAHSSCITRQASPSGAGLSCCAPSELRDRARSPLPCPAPFAVPPAKRGC